MESFVQHIGIYGRVTRLLNMRKLYTLNMEIDTEKEDHLHIKWQCLFNSHRRRAAVVMRCRQGGALERRHGSIRRPLRGSKIAMARKHEIEHKSASILLVTVRD